MIRPALLLALLASPLSAQKFEGVIMMTISEGGRSMPMTYQVKDGKVRYDMGGPNGAGVAMIVDPTAQKMYMVMASQRMAMETDLSGMASEGQAAVKDPNITRTGRTETIAGYKCEHIIIVDEKNGSTDVCATSELGATFEMASPNPMGMAKQPKWVTDMRGTFPLRVQQGGKTIIEVTKAEKKSLDASLFTIPEGFQKMAMPMPPMRRP